MVESGRRVLWIHAISRESTVVASGRHPAWLFKRGTGGSGRAGISGTKRRWVNHPPLREPPAVKTGTGEQAASGTCGAGIASERRSPRKYCSCNRL